MKKKILTLTILTGSLLLAGCAGSTGATSTASSAAETSSAADDTAPLIDYEINRDEEIEIDTGINPDEYIEPGKYTDISVPVEEVEIPQEDVDAAINEECINYSSEDVVTNTAAAIGHRLTADITATLDGEEVESLTHTAYTFTLGESHYGYDFDQNLLGVKSRESREFDLTYPEYYLDEELQGKTVHFVVDVEMITEFDDFDLTDDWVQEITDNQYDNIDDFEQACSDWLFQENTNMYIANYIREAILDDSTVKAVPDAADLTEELEKYQEKDMDYMAHDLMTEYLKLTYGSMYIPEDADLEDVASYALQSEVLLTAIGEAENITLTEGEYADAAEQFLTDYDWSGYGNLTMLENAAGKENVEKVFWLQKVTQYLLKNSKTE